MRTPHFTNWFCGAELDPLNLRIRSKNRLFTFKGDKNKNLCDSSREFYLRNYGIPKKIRRI